MKTAWGLTGQPDACGGDESRVFPIVWGYLGLIFMLILLSEQNGARQCVLGSRQRREVPRQVASESRSIDWVREIQFSHR